MTTRSTLVDLFSHLYVTRIQKVKLARNYYLFLCFYFLCLIRSSQIHRKEFIPVRYVSFPEIRPISMSYDLS